MKKSLLIFMLLVLVVALVACGGEKTPDVTEGEDTPAATTTVAGDTPAATTTKAPAADKFTVKFVDADQFGNAVINESTVARGKAARAPLDPSHEGYIFLGWDVEDYSSITADTTITATYRPVDTYSVTFYDADGKALAAPITVKEGEAVTAPQAPVIYGKIFDSWDKQIGQVDRAWPDFEQYKNLSAEEIAKKPLEYKVTATYKDSDGIIMYKSSISMDFVESKDADGKKIPLKVYYSEKEKGLILADKANPGMFHTVDGEKADWNVNKSYWAFYLGEEYAVKGIYDTPITDGAVYKLVYTIG